MKYSEPIGIIAGMKRYLHDQLLEVISKPAG
jgi:hypothetical protein